MSADTKGAVVRTGPIADRVSHPADAPSAVQTGGVQIAQLLELAVNKGMPAAELKELVTLAERMEDRNARKEFTRALAAVKAEMPPIIHSKKVDYVPKSGGRVNYSYTELDELARVVDPILTKHGFSYNWSQTFEKDRVTTTCTLEHDAGHSRSSSFTVPAENNSAASPQQKIGMADTYAARRSLIGVLGLTTVDKDPRPAEIDPTPINGDQAIEITEMIKETGADLGRFLKHFDTESIEDLLAVRYDEAITTLRQKAARKGATR